MAFGIGEAVGVEQGVAIGEKLLKMVKSRDHRYRKWYADESGNGMDATRLARMCEPRGRSWGVAALACPIYYNARLTGRLRVHAFVGRMMRSTE